MWQGIYSRFIKPRSNTEDNRRRELVLNILLVGSIVLSCLSLISATIGHLEHPHVFNAASLLELSVICLFFFSLYGASRRGHYRSAAYVFVGSFFLLSTYPVFIWGILLPQAILTYALVIVMTGVLLNSRAAFYVTLLTIIALVLIKYLEDSFIIRFDSNWMNQTGGYNDVVIYGLTFGLVATVAWLSNRETERSLIRARKSEKDLRLERSSLEVKVLERTKNLEATQAKQLRDMNRFTEFGRVSANLLHELSNPLTSLSLNIEQLETEAQTAQVKQIRESFKFMDNYVKNARRQLRNTSEIRSFDAAMEIRAVNRYLEPKAKMDKVKVKLKLVKDVTLLGDSTRFNQIIANLIVNAIDASAENRPGERFILVEMQLADLYVEINVSDKGSGISSNKIGRIFDPFFTTKSSDKGTGLGLTIVKTAVEEDFKGTITVTSTRSEGTCFSLVLPLP